MSLEAVLTDDNFMNLDVSLDRLPTVEEYNKEYQTQIDEDEYSNYIEDNWAWRIGELPKRYFYNPKNTTPLNNKEKKIAIQNNHRAIKWIINRYKNQKIKKDSFTDNNLGGSFIQCYKSILETIQDAFPNEATIQLYPWLLTKEGYKGIKIFKLPENYFYNPKKDEKYTPEERIIAKQNNERAVKWFLNKYKGKTISKSILIKKGLGGLLEYHDNSTFNLIKSIFPNEATIQLYPWVLTREGYKGIKITSLSNNYFYISKKDNKYKPEEKKIAKQNNERAVKWFLNKYKGEIIKTNTFEKEGLAGFHTNYNQSFIKLLQDIFPNDATIQLYPWKLRTKEGYKGIKISQLKGYFTDLDNRIRAFKKELGNLKMEEISNKVEFFRERGIIGLLNYYYEKRDIQSLTDEYNNYFTNKAGEILKGQSITDLIRKNGCSVKNLDKTDIKLPLLALLQTYLGGNQNGSNGKSKNGDKRSVTYKNQAITKIESLTDGEWTDINETIAPNQFLNALIWGGLNKLSESDKEKFMQERLIGLRVGDILLDERKHSTTGIESYLINDYINDKYPDIKPTLSIGSGDGNDLMPGDIGIDLNPINELVIKADATTHDYSQYKNIKSISFPYSLHSMPRNWLGKLKDFNNFIITLPYNGDRREKLLEELISSVGERDKEQASIKVRYTYEDESTKIKPVNADILRPMLEQKPIRKIKSVPRVKMTPILIKLRDKKPERFKELMKMLQKQWDSDEILWDDETMIGINWANKKARQLLI